ncbi:MAG: ATP-binding protein [Actinomycetales bacterium]|nr:ATP-binding protein [Actinomycetales bacterium]
MRERLSADWAAMPLRRRLVLGLLSVMAVTLVVVAGATYYSLRAWTIQGIDASLEQAKSHVFSDINDRGSVNEAVQAWSSSGATVYLVTADGAAAPLTPSIPGAPTPTQLSAADAAALQAVPTGREAAAVSVTLSTLGPSRAVAIPVNAGTSDGTLVAATPLSKADAVAARLLLVEVIAVVLALIFAGIVATWFVRRSLRPLKEVAETASEVARLPLERGDVDIPARVHDPIPTTEVGQVGLAVNAMLDHVESSLKTRADTEERLRRFVSDAGHELRTPLAAVRGYAELMRRGAAGDPEQARHAAERIEAAGSRMGLLVEDLLLLASLDEERPLAHDVVDLNRLVDEAVAEAATAGPDHQWAVEEGDEHVTVIGDGTRLHQAIANLLANCRAHTPAGTSVTITVTADPTTARVEVRDDGPGFPAQLLPRVTERFARGDASRSRATGGSGLGLAIVKAVTEAHRGTVDVGNGPGGVGAVVRMSLPMAAAPQASTVIGSASAPMPPVAVGAEPVRADRPETDPAAVPSSSS